MNLESSVLTALPTKQEGKPFLQILKESITLDEKLMAIYTEAINNISFKPLRAPSTPSGFSEVYKAYLESEKEEKSSMWKGILEHKEFKKYFLENERIEHENLSNKKFLNEMKKYFEDKCVFLYVDKINELLKEYL